MEKHGNTWKHMEKTHEKPWFTIFDLQYVTVYVPIFPRSDSAAAVNLIQEVGRELCLSDHLDVMGKKPNGEPIVKPSLFLEDHPQRMEVNNFNMLCINNI